MNSDLVVVRLHNSLEELDGQLKTIIERVIVSRQQDEEILRLLKKLSKDDSKGGEV